MLLLLLQIIFFPLALIFVIVIRLLSPFILVRYACLQTTRLGHMSSNLELYSISKKNKFYEPNLKYFDIFYPKKVIVNTQLYKMIKRENFCLPYFFMSSVEKINLIFEIFFYSKNKYDIGYGYEYAEDIAIVPRVKQIKPYDEFLKKDFKINFRNVDFKYKNSDKYIIQNLNFEINKNDTIGIIGESGIGKSTFIDLLSGLLFPTSGTITFNDLNINYNLSQYQKQISYIHQKIPIISGTILDNICLGSDTSNVDMKLLWKSLDYAQLSQFIRQDSDLYRDIGEYGSMISGGQLQRLGIARALYKNSSIIILDEPTSALDDTTEEKFINFLFNTLESKTVILVSHNIKLVKKCQKVIQISQEGFNPFKI